MPISGGVDKLEAERALDILNEAANIEANPKMVKAVTEVARQRADNAVRVAERLGVKGGPPSHPDSVRKDRVKF